MHQCTHRYVAREQIQPLADIDVSGVEQRLAHGFPEVVDSVGDRKSHRLEEDLPSKAQTVAVDAATGDSDDAVPRRHFGSGVDGVELDTAHRGRCQIKPNTGRRALDDIAHFGDLAARD